MSLTELRSDWLIGYYASGRGKFSAETISINSFSSERVDSKSLNGRWRLLGTAPVCIERSNIWSIFCTVYTLLGLLPPLSLPPKT